MTRLFAVCSLAAVAAGIAFAGTSVAVTPEVDAATGLGALTLISGGLLILLSRKK